MHALRHSDCGESKSKNCPAPTLSLNSSLLAKSILAKNIPLGAFSTELADVILRKLQRDEERAVELGIGT